MHRYLIHAITMTAVLVVAGSDVARARPNERFTLEDKDKLLVEAPGCHAVCGISTPTRRECSVRESDCHVVCQGVPECKPDGIRPIQVCAVVKEHM